jgi:uncharacterized LabA/DUF88 family protein
MVTGSSISYPPTPHLKRIMVFIDGGYFRKILENHFGGDFKNDPTRIVRPLELILAKINEINFFPYSQLEIIRIYYYDGLVQTSDPTYNEREEFFKRFKSGFTSKWSLELKFGRLIKGADNQYRQKGVDVLLSIDLVVKAFQDHYDVAMLIAGDDDFVDAVKVVKDLTGKRIIGLYKQDETSSRLIESFDFKLPTLPIPFFGDFKI